MTSPAPGAVISVVIPTYRREQPLCDTLDRLLALDLDRCEILVVDQTEQHEPATEAYLASVAHRITRLRLDIPSVCRARNVGWRAARGDIVLFLDDDVIPGEGLLEAHRQAYADRTVGGVAGRIITTGFPLVERQSLKSRLPGVGWLFFNFAQTAPAEVATARGCHMSFARAVLEALGGFDERYVPSPCSREESDFCFRLRRHGYRLIFEPRAVVEHLMADAGGSRSVERDQGLSLTHHTNNAYFVYKNLPRAQRLVTWPAMVIQEFRPGWTRCAPRTWRDELRVAQLILAGAWHGWFRFRARRAGDA